MTSPYFFLLMRLVLRHPQSCLSTFFTGRVVMARLDSRKFSALCSILRNFSTKHPVGAQSLVESVAVTDDGSTFAAWHPKPTFPYELSKPIPPPVERDNSSLLKDNALNTAMQAFKQKHPQVVREELSRITHTTKHRWFPRARDKRAKRDTPMDRPYL